MKRSNRFIIGLVAAAITFGSLMAFVPERFAKHGHCGHHGYMHHHHCSDGCATEKGATDNQ